MITFQNGTKNKNNLFTIFQMSHKNKSVHVKRNLLIRYYISLYKI